MHVELGLMSFWPLHNCT